MTQRLWLVVVLAASLLTGCPKQEPSTPVVGVYAAASPLVLQMKVGPRGIAVGSFLFAQAKLTATGPAVLEFFGGAIRFLDRGDTLAVDDAPEKDLVSSNLPQFQLRAGKLVALQPSERVITPLYFKLQVLPEGADPQKDSGDYLRGSFVAPAVSTAGSELAPLAKPPPPFRGNAPRIHAGDLGDGGPTATVNGTFAAAQSDELATAILLPGRTIDLGRTTRVLVPKGSEVAVKFTDGTTATLPGPGDFRIR